MPFISEILKYGSLSIAGLEKNTGKTESLNYILRNIPEEVSVAVTSIGTDGERRDIVTHTPKPEIRLREGVLFATAEQYYKRRKVVSEILDVGSESSAAGRMVTARTLSEGSVMLSGPSSAVGLRRWMDSVSEYGAKLTIIDGALSRLSSASPAVSEAVILSTGAAFSADMNTLVKETAHVAEMINLPLVTRELAEKLEPLGQGVWTVDKEGNVSSSGIVSPLAVADIAPDFAEDSDVVYVNGALTERFLNLMKGDKRLTELELVVRDFTKIFVPSRAYAAFLKRGGRLSVLDKSKLIAITVNPVAPNGYVMDSVMLREKLAREVSVPVYDIFMPD